MARTGKCSGCCTRQLDCESCARCLPRYLCVDVEVTPGPYTESLECCDEAYGLGHFSFRMTQSCGAWSGAGTCPGLAGSFDLSVTLDGDCNTVITSSLMEDALTFEGVLPAGMSGTAETDAGDILDWEISRANVVENPLAKDICSPCACATCLPERLCVQIQASGDAYNPPIEEAISMLWDCESKAWVADGAMPDGFDLTIAMKPASDGICGIDVTAGGEYGEYTGVILLEGPLHSRKFHGTLCEDSDGLIDTLGVPELKPCDPPTPCQDPPPQEYLSFIDETITLMDGDVQTGTVTIRDQSCGACIDQDCAGPPIQTNCCEFVPIPRMLHAQWSYGGCTPECEESESIFIYDPNFDTSNPLFPFSLTSVVWVSHVAICDMLFTAWLACITTSEETYSWSIYVPNAPCNGGGGVGASGATQVCSPFYAKFGWSWTGNCCPDGSVGVGMIVEIIV